MANLSGMQMMQINNNNKNLTVGKRDPGELENFVSVLQSDHMCDLQPVYSHQRV